MNWVKKSKVVILFLFIWTGNVGVAQDLEWFNQIKDIYDDIDINDVVTDQAGNVYIGGSFDNQKNLAVDNSAPAEVNFMGSVQSSPSEQNGFLAKVNSAGTLQWIKTFGSPQSTTGYSPLAMIEKNGYLYVVGSFQYGAAPGLDFDPDAGTRQIQSVSSTDFFVSKYNCSTGAMVWAYAGFGGGGSDLPSGIVIDNSENIYVSGQCNNSASPSEVDFNIKAPTHNAAQIGIASTNQLYVVSYDKDCNFRWRNNIANSTNNGNGTRNLAIDLTNSYIYFTGGVSQASGVNPSFSGTSLTVDASTNDGFIAKYDFSGALQWVKNVVKGTGANLVRAVDVDGSGNIYVAGSFNGTADFDPSAGTSSLTSAGSLDGFVAKYNSSGVRQWSYRIGSTSFGEMITSIKLTWTGDIVVGGEMHETFDVNPEGTGGAQSRGAAAQRFIYFGQYDTDFKYKWAYGLGSGTTTNGGQIANAVNIDLYNSPYPVYVFGYMNYLGTENFNPSGAGVFAPSFVPQTATGVTSPAGNQFMGDNGFLAKYSTTSIVLPIELKMFNVTCLNSKHNVNWTTVTETNNDYFTLERSEGGKDWEVLSVIKGQGTKLSETHYHYEDENQYREGRYYRLKQTDFNGKHSFLEIIYSNCSNKEDFVFNIFPNPTQGVFNLQFEQELRNKYKLKIVDVMGRVVFLQNDIPESCDLTSQAEGIYFMHLYSDKDLITKKIVLQK